MTDQPITVIATIRVHPDHEKAAVAAIHDCVKASRLEKSNISYQCHRDVSDREVFVFVERWTSSDALAEHETTPHFRAMAEVFRAALAEPLHVRITREI
ncbi:antibiotic biosynthesis monooxygenase [Komagataeibacter oboediens]|uniref:putative quinol monooxygenase n=1 Tax=Komagataeibacter oboediens TaxID=65958 RepID=UPI001C2C371B|nr:putative quinol monooxygenase [Komagataeibacter oboediens]MBV0888168.1 antibiotic biosynthesis monooxygenase [Komagataeibacter oboediens]MCK9820729.1 antibiotic biosynthesis monooxygenase [Komagataeibacter oboediens]